MERVEQSGTVNYDLIVIRLAVVVSYSSRVQQPMRAMAIMNGHQRTLQAATFGREQGRADSLHPDGFTRAVPPTCTSERP
jgi:hypothetical protein